MVPYILQRTSKIGLSLISFFMLQKKYTGASFSRKYYKILDSTALLLQDHFKCITSTKKKIKFKKNIKSKEKIRNGEFASSKNLMKKKKKKKNIIDMHQSKVPRVECKECSLNCIVEDSILFTTEGHILIKEPKFLRILKQESIQNSEEITN